MPDKGTDYGDLAYIVILVVFVIGGAVLKWIGKLLSGKGKTERREPQARGPATGDGGSGPEQALEQLFQKAKRKSSEPADIQPVPEVRRPSAAESLNDFFDQVQGKRPSPAPPVAQAIPVARSLPAARKATAARRPQPRHPAVTVAEPVDPYSSEALASAKATIARGKKPGRRKARAVQQPAPALGLSGALAGPLRRQDLIRAVVYSEILGRPRAVTPYMGPPAAE